MSTNPSSHPRRAPLEPAHGTDNAALEAARAEQTRAELEREHARLRAVLDPGKSSFDAATALIIVSAVALGILVGLLYWAMQAP